MGDHREIVDITIIGGGPAGLLPLFMQACAKHP